MAPNLSEVLVQSFPTALVTAFRATWYFWMGSAVVIFTKIGVTLYKKRKLAKAGMYEIDLMSGQEFESFLATLFQQMGYLVKQVGSFAGDYGADLVISKDGQTVGVQAKRHKSVIGVDAVREALGSIKMYKCKSAMVVTNSYYTKQAKKLAKANSIELWDRNILANEILKFNN